MKLAVATPLSVLYEADDVVHLRAEDATGAFGILPGHADFLTALSISVASWRDSNGVEHHAAVRGGMLEVTGGNAISIATREAVLGDDLEQLETDVIARFRRQLADEQTARADAQRLYLAAIHRIYSLLGPGAAQTGSLSASPGWPEGSGQ